MNSARDVYIELQHLRHRRQLTEDQFARSWSNDMPTDMALDREVALNQVGGCIFALAEDAAARSIPTHPLVYVQLLREYARESDDVVYRLAALLCEDLLASSLNERWLRQLGLPLVD